MNYNKITTGFVIQKYITLGDKRICIGQEFVAGDQVEYEDHNGNTMVVNTDKEIYCAFEMVKPQVVATRGLSFICPKCGKEKLECVMENGSISGVLAIHKDGLFEFDNSPVDSELLYYQCENCGFQLPCDNDQDVVVWIKENCEQPEGYTDPRYLDDNVK